MRAYRKLALHRRVLVNLKDGRAFDAILWDERGDLVVLRDATLIGDGEPAKLDGDVLVERVEVAFVQVVP